MRRRRKVPALCQKSAQTTLDSRFRGNDGALDSRLRGNDDPIEDARSCSACHVSTNPDNTKKMSTPSHPIVTSGTRSIWMSGTTSAGCPALSHRWYTTTHPAASARTPVSASTCCSRSAATVDIAPRRLQSAVVGFVFDVGAIARLADELLKRFLALALRDRLPRLRALAILGDVLLTAPEHFDQVPAERGAYRLRQLVHLERVHRLFERGHGFARGQPTGIAAFGAGCIVGIDLRLVLELGAANYALADAVDLGLGFGLGDGFIRAHEYVARMRLLDHRRRIAIALVDELDDVKPGRAADDLGNIALFHRAHGVEVDARQSRSATPAQVAAGQCCLRVGVAGGDLAEVGAAFDLRQRVLGALVPLLDDVRLRFLRHAHDDVRQQVLVLASCLRRCRLQVIVDLGFADEYVLLDLAFAQALQRELAANVLAIGGVRQALLGKHVAEFVGRHLVVLLHAQDRALDERVVDLDARFLRKLHQCALVDQPLEHLLGEHVPGGYRNLRFVQLANRLREAFVDVVLRNGLVVDDGDDAI